MSDTRFTFVQLEFTHAIGPDPGRYVVGEAGAAREEDADPRAFGSGDVLLVAVEGARIPSFRSKLGSRRWQRAHADAAPAPVPIALATMVRGREPLASEADAAARLDEWRRSDLKLRKVVGEAVALVNRAIRAHRAAIGDAYLSEILAEDARAIRIGYGTGDGLLGGRWDVGYLVPRPQRLLSGRGRLGPTGAVAAVLRGDDHVLEMEDALLRVALDLDQGRVRLAAQELRAATSLAAVELGAGDLQSEADALAVRALRTPIPPIEEALLALAMTLTERLRKHIRA